MIPLRKSLFLALGGLIFFAASPALARDQITVTEGWARLAPVQGRPMSVYFTIQNQLHTEDRLLGAVTDAAEEALLHVHIMDGAIARMRPAASIPVPAGTMTIFAPGGVHVMLHGPRPDMAVGDQFELILIFEKGGRHTILVSVFAPGSTGPYGGRPAAGKPGYSGYNQE